MYCPRCGSPNNDTTKFCRQCGLGLQQVTGYVASGGTAQLPQQPPVVPSNPLVQATDGFTPKQKMILAILLMVLSPAIFGTFGAVTGFDELGAALAAISAILMPIGIVFAVMRYKAQQRRMEQATMQQPFYPPPPVQPMQYQMPPPVAPYSLPQGTQQPVQQPVMQPQNHQPPVYHQPAPPPTNPLGPGSVIEDETRRLPDQRA
jgi:hypothetical protein